MNHLTMSKGTDHQSEEFSNLSDIQQFFYGQSVFLTGITGLVGKVLLEKILRCCPGVGMIYVLLRGKKGLKPEERLEKIFKVELFKYMKEVLPDYSKKVKIVEGDITQDRLGMSLEDFEKIRENVSIILHSAASVNFTDPLRTAVEHNILPVLRIIELCHEMPHLKALVHLSTAYVKREPDKSVLEQIPRMKVAPFQLLDALEWMDNETINSVTKCLLENKFTTYMISKALAEGVIEEKRGDLPVAIVRPCYISPTFKDPFPGWCDALQGLAGLLLAGAKGALRTLRSVKNLKMNIVPVDIVANTIMTSAWHVGTTKPSPLFIINCVLDYEKLPYADESVLKWALTKRDEYPLVQMFRYPHFTIYYSDLPYYVHAMIDQWIPALFIDFFLYIFTGKTILIKVYYKIHTLYDIFYRIGKDPWICRIENYNMLMNKQSKKDSEIFVMDGDQMDWSTYMNDCLYGGRRYLAREDPSNIPYARKKAKIWWAVTTTLKWLLILYFVYYFITRFFISQ